MSVHTAVDAFTLLLAIMHVVCFFFGEIAKEISAAGHPLWMFDLALILRVVTLAIFTAVLSLRVSISAEISCWYGSCAIVALTFTTVLCLHQ